MVASHWQLYTVNTMLLQSHGASLPSIFILIKSAPLSPISVIKIRSYAGFMLTTKHVVLTFTTPGKEHRRLLEQGADDQIIIVPYSYSILTL